jgi:hypothetical protein
MEESPNAGSIAVTSVTESPIKEGRLTYLYTERHCGFY